MSAIEAPASLTNRETLKRCSDDLRALALGLASAGAEEAALAPVAWAIAAQLGAARTMVDKALAVLTKASAEQEPELEDLF